MRRARIRTADGLVDAVVVELAGEDTVLTVPDGSSPQQVIDDPTTAGAELSLEKVRFAPPVTPGKIICVGLNYADHAAEGGQQAPDQPILFMKAPDTMIGARDDIVLPRGSVKTDWEVELGVVIGGEPTGTAYLDSEEQADAYIAGYVLVDDVSEREFQLERGGQWDKGKNCATFCPIGPWLLTADEVPDPQAIRLGLEVNGQPLQDSDTGRMIFGVRHLVHYISQYLTLYPGDVISTGTPAGVGAGQHPPRYLTAGDTVRAWADGLGQHLNQVRSN
ncbi:fumarylacetoacetate hydrolase family protein [Microlunatus soli]|uniref:2-keto-4-pentenoate hydratase/2-oxohepta-3-ene-1,7-dioic acid hydratase (Catechol pathway) n=1 Tax=Microlunatus soli TaxID=630515 RepID=A0A1H1R7H3_9ACTN|nr:fumarylacetoacetate hydrolase family protein [Microlunatus soli]SDS31595.1 2-keto-4-pentenoate hydratase/2-oxohepta-3-ene-1,7-dioic acid hydratase (catechol pathway) [Microlunatus soli]